MISTDFFMYLLQQEQDRNPDHSQHVLLYRSDQNSAPFKILRGVNIELSKIVKDFCDKNPFVTIKQKDLRLYLIQKFIRRRITSTYALTLGELYTLNKMMKTGYTVSDEFVNLANMLLMEVYYEHEQVPF